MASKNDFTAVGRALRGYDCAIQMVELELRSVLSGEDGVFFLCPSIPYRVMVECACLPAIAPPLDSESHPEFQYQAAGLKRQRDRAAEDAERNLAAMAVSVEAVFAHENEVIENDFRQAMNKVKEQKAAQLSEQISALELKRDYGNGKHVTRSTRSKATTRRFGEADCENDDADGPGGALAALANFASREGASRQRGPRRPQSLVAMLLNKELDEDEVRSDLYDIARDAKLVLHAAGVVECRDDGSDDDYDHDDEEGGRGPPRKRFISAASPRCPAEGGGPAAHPKPAAQAAANGNGAGRSHPASPPGAGGAVNVLSNLKLGTLAVQGELFSKGDVVIATVCHSGSSSGGGGGGGPGVGGRAGGTSASVGAGPVHGVVSSVNNSEVHLKLTVGGSKHRIYLSHLRNGRVTLAHA